MSKLTTGDELFKLIDNCTNGYTNDEKFTNGVWHRFGIVDREKLLTLFTKYLNERETAAYEKGVDATIEHSFTAPEIKEVIVKVFKTKTEPKMISIILEDVEEALASFRSTESKS